MHFDTSQKYSSIQFVKNEADIFFNAVNKCMEIFPKGYETAKMRHFSSAPDKITNRWTAYNFNDYNYYMWFRDKEDLIYFQLVFNLC